MENIIIAIIVLIIIFLLAREFWAWYWKINARMKQIDTMNENLEQIKKLLIHQTAIISKSNTANGEDKLPDL